MRYFPITFALTAAVCGSVILAQSFRGRPAIELANDRLQITLLQNGGSIASMVLRDDPQHLNPLWDPPNVDTAGVGHFLCLDAFGPTSKEELAAGLQFHGEAIRTRFEKLNQGDRDGISTVAVAATLPLVQERVVRTYELKKGETALFVRTRVESQVAFDRPMVWAEHGTIGSPFLDRGVTAVDVHSVQSETRPYEQKGKRRLAPGREFKWPEAPLASGGTVNMRTPPPSSDSMDHITNLMDRSREYAFATAVNPKRRLIVGWVWKTSDFPWLQIWENYPANGMLARGMEFSTQPFDISRRDAVAMNPTYGAPTFRWLPAKSAVETTFVLFYAHVPEGFDKVEDAKIEKGAIVLSGAGGNKVSVPASLVF